MLHYFFMLRLISYFFVIVTGLILILALSLDVNLLINSEESFSTIGELWYRLSPTSLQISEVIVSRYIDPCNNFNQLNCGPFLWHPIISSILLFPATITFFIGTLFWLLILRMTKKKKSSFYFKY